MFRVRVQINIMMIAIHLVFTAAVPLYIASFVGHNVGIILECSPLGTPAVGH